MIKKKNIYKNNLNNLFKLKNAQASLEYMFIIGVGLSLILIISAAFFTYFNDEKEVLNKEFIESIGHNLISTSQKMYYQGIGDRVTISTRFPEGINNLSIVQYASSTGENVSILRFNVLNNAGDNNFDFFPDDEIVKIDCTVCNKNVAGNVSWYNFSNYNVGDKKIRIENKGDYVSIDFVND